ncbi:MAG: NAD(P)/FAD-dependent oxidoreductase [Actinomycetales bacterium]|nr:NAD(P)/FAD-dependent oxidoreductase [Actinomycetales bacterium]
MYDALILGGGAAGLSAAVALGRAGRRVLVLDAGSPRNRFASHMHTVLGHEGTDPVELLARGRAEARRYGVEIVPGWAVTLREVRGAGSGADDGGPRRDEHAERAVTDGALEDGPLLELSTSEGAVVVGRAALLATGLTDRLPEVPGLAERWGRSVLHCPYCHGWEVRGRRLGVLVTGPVGFHQAQLIRQWSEFVTVFAHGHEVPDDVARRLRSRGVEIVPGEVLELLGEGPDVTAVRTADGALTEIDAIFTASTLEPNDACCAPLGLERAELPMGMGSFVAVDATGRTSHERVWAAGNVINPALGVAASMGAGTQVGGAINMALITAEFDRAELERAELERADA